MHQRSSKAMETNRLEAFSDAVFAIAITLLILEIKVPPAPLLPSGLVSLWPSYLAYAISFVVIGAIWINHHAMFALIKATNQRLLLLNTLQLLFVAFLPFPTAVLAEAMHARAYENVAAAFYGSTLMVIGLFVACTWFYVSKCPALLSDSVSPAQAKAMRRRYLVGPFGYALATLGAFINPWISIGLFVALNIYFLWPRD